MRAKGTRWNSNRAHAIYSKGWLRQTSAIQNGSNPQSSASTQQSDASILTGDDPPPGKKARTEEEDLATDNKPVDWEDSQAPLVALSDAASAFLETTFGSKLDNKTRVAKRQGTPDSQWIRCMKIDQVVATI